MLETVGDILRKLLCVTVTKRVVARQRRANHCACFSGV